MGSPVCNAGKSSLGDRTRPQERGEGREYKMIVDMACEIREISFRGILKLLMWYDQAITRMGEE